MASSVRSFAVRFARHVSSSWQVDTLNRNQRMFSLSLQQRVLFSSQESEPKRDDAVIDGKDYLLGSGPNTMRAAVFWEPGKPMTLEDLQMPRPQTGEVLIKTKACGVCHSDLHVIKGDQPYRTPVVLGHEVTGEIIEHGPHTNEATRRRLPVGERVVGAFIMPCGGCFYCVKGQEEICETFFKYNRGMGGLYDGKTRLYQHSSGKLSQLLTSNVRASFIVMPLVLRGMFFLMMFLYSVD